MIPLRISRYLHIYVCSERLNIRCVNSVSSALLILTTCHILSVEKEKEGKVNCMISIYKNILIRLPYIPCRLYLRVLVDQVNEMRLISAISETESGGTDYPGQKCYPIQFILLIPHNNVQGTFNMAHDPMCKDSRV